MFSRGPIQIFNDQQVVDYSDYEPLNILKSLEAVSVVKDVETLYMQNIDVTSFKIADLDATIFQDVMSIDCLDQDCDEQIKEYLAAFQAMTADFDPNKKVNAGILKKNSEVCYHFPSDSLSLNDPCKNVDEASQL